MQFDWATFGLQIVNVLVLLAILRHFLFRPISDIVARRQAEIVAANEAAEAARLAAQQAEADARAEAERTAGARPTALSAARTEAEARRKDLIAAAQADAARIVDEARAEAARIAADAEARALRRASDLAATIARSVLSALPNPPDTARFAERLAGHLAAMPEDTRTALLAGERLRLVAPRRLSHRDLTAAGKALAPFGLGDLALEVDPSLIAGLDLRSTTGTVSNSVSHDLERISEALHDGDGSRA